MKKLIELVEKNLLTKSATIGLLITLVLTVLNSTGRMQSFWLNRLDSMYKSRTELENDPNITIWTIFEDDLEYSRFPWSWEKYEALASALKNYKARLGVFMFEYFSEEGSLNINTSDATEIQSSLGAQLDKGVSFKKALDDMAPDHNDRFIKVVEKQKNLMFSQTFVIPDNQSDPVQLQEKFQARKAAFLPAKKESVELMRKFGQPWPGSPAQLVQAIDVNPLAHRLLESAGSLGFKRIFADPDGVIRKCATVVYFDGHLYFSQAVLAFAASKGCKISDIEVVPGRHLRFKGVKGRGGQDVSIPIDEKGFMFVNWTSKAQLFSFNNIPMTVVRFYLQREMAKSLIKDTPYEEELVSQFQQQYISRIEKFGWIKPGADASMELKMEILAAWMMNTGIESGAEFHEVREVMIELLGQENTKYVLGMDLLATYNTLRINRALANILAKKQPAPSLEALMKKLDIREYEESVARLVSIEVKPEYLEKLHMAGLMTIRDIQDDQIACFTNTNLSEQAYLKLLMEKLKLDKKTLEDFNYSFPLNFITKKNMGLFREGYRQTLHHARNGTIADAQPLYFHAAESLDIGSRSIEYSLLDTKDQVVFIDLTATGLNALNPTPFGQRDMMAGLMPAVLNTIINESFIVDLAWSAYAFVILYGIGIFYLAYRLRFYFSLPVAVVLGLLHLKACYWVFEHHGLILAVDLPLIAIVLSYVAAMLYQYWEQQRERKKIRGMFSSMVSPDVLKIMEEDPDKFNLKGEKVYASMFSSDVSGFTSISEGVTAQELAIILNLYLTPMSNLVMTYEGYVEKYEGDAIKADFGMPVAKPGHAWKACYSAILQQEELNVVKRMLQLKYGVAISARMGVNTGYVSAGNMGSENKMQYCAIGHEVMMAEELEPSNKMWETWIAISEETKSMSEDRLELRHLDNVIYDHDVVPVYEVLGWKREAFLEFWKKEPIPALIIEGWQKIIPEKILAYIEYYAQKKVQPNDFFNAFITTLKGLEELSIECVRLTDKIEMYQLNRNLEALANEFSLLGRKIDETKFSAIDRNEVDKLKKNLADAGEPWLKFVCKNLLQLKLHSHLLAQSAEHLDQVRKDDLNNKIDTYEKNCNCIIKRNGFPTPDDKNGNLFKSHLCEILKNPGQNFVETDVQSLSQKVNAIKQKIKADMDAFIAKAKTMPLQYHEFIADHGMVQPAKQKVVSIFSEGRKLYLSRQWDQAEAKFKEGLALVADDGPCMTFAKRCNDFKKNPPPADWNGDWKANW